MGQETPKKKNSFIQVPGSSPTSQLPPSSPQPIPHSRLASLKDRFSFKAVQTPTGSMNSSKQNVLLLKKKYPYIDTTKIIEVFNDNNRNLRATSAKLSLVPKPVDNDKNNNTTLKKEVFKPFKQQTSPVKEETNTKVVLDKPRTSIAARYLNKNKIGSINNLHESPIITKKRKLMRGTKEGIDDEPVSVLTLLATKSGSKKAIVSLSDSEEEHLLEDDDFDDSSDEEVVMVSTQSVFDDRVLSFLNNSDKRDLVDIAGITPAVADIFIKHRPFNSLYQIQSNDFSENETVSTKKSRKKLTGEKIVDKTTITLKGYDAVDSLIKKCSEYGDLIASEIKKWGVGIDGNAGELELVEVDVDSDENEVEEIHESHHTKVVDVSENEASSEEDSDENYSDEDDEVTSKNKRSKIRHLNNPKRYFKRKPALLAPDVELKNYQQVGLNWLNLLYQNNLSCILADEMGLGKTCEIIAFLAHLKELNYSGPHLVVVPSSTLENWLREFEKFCPSLVVVPYYGTQQERADQRYELEDTSKYDVLVTTYNLATGNKYDQNFLRSCKFNVIIYDEGHMLKNSASDRYVKLMKLKANFRVLLTGTPLQNNLRELISLLAFILPSLFVEKKSDLITLFDQKVTTATADDSNSGDGNSNFNPLLSQQAISKAKTMMTPFVLRRKKEQVLKHLPAKIQFIEHCQFTPKQKELYDGLVEHARALKQIKLQKELDKKLNKNGLKIRLEKSPSESESSSTNVIMQLRKAALHPLLFRRNYDDIKIRKMAKNIMNEPEYVDANPEFIFEDMQVMSDFELDRLCSKFPATLSNFSLPEDEFFDSGKVLKLKELLKDIIEGRGERLLIFSLFTQVLDILERCLSILKITFIRLDGQTTVNERQQIIDTFYQDQTIPVFLLSTKAGGFGINLVCTNNVIIFDLSFNPHDDKQAEDRCHRVGQTKEVNVYRLITDNSIEENIYLMGQSKLQLDKSVSEEELLLSLV